MNRKERRLQARLNGTTFEPQYKGKVYTYEEYYGIGYERFNNKFVEVSKLVSNN